MNPTYPDILRPPDSITAYAENAAFRLNPPQGEAVWQAHDICVRAEPAGSRMEVSLTAPDSALRRLHLRWQGGLPEDARLLGDQWERAYGDLEWRGFVAERVMPWYFLLHVDGRTHGWGVQTGAAALCFWQADPKGISLWIDVRSGGQGVRLGTRHLHAATLVAREGQEGETAFQASQSLCRLLCPQPNMPSHPVYGSNNWYYAYGNSSHAEIIADTDILAGLAPASDNRPFMTIDAGWQAISSPAFSWCGGPWDRGNARFPDMAGLAQAIKDRGARPGLWMRPLAAAPGMDSSRLLPLARVQEETARVAVLDPSLPENLEQIRADVRGMHDWGYELIKHDWTACDLLGRWGSDMGAKVTADGWRFADNTRTTAEIVLDLYRTIQEGAQDSLVIGCNTIGHLAAGIFAMQRTGDDTSGKEWERTRRMGVNTLAFRMAQHGTFFAVDADCVGLTQDVPWAQNRQWLDILARSGTPLFVSAAPDALGPEQEKALKAAFAAAAQVQPIAEPLDWLQTSCPARWRVDAQEVTYDWYGAEGALPFPA